MTCIQAMRCKGLYGSILVRQFFFSYKRDMCDSRRYIYPFFLYWSWTSQWSCRNFISIMTSKYEDQRPIHLRWSTETERIWVLNDIEGQLHQHHLSLSPLNIFLGEISFSQKHLLPIQMAYSLLLFACFKKLCSIFHSLNYTSYCNISIKNMFL